MVRTPNRGALFWTLLATIGLAPGCLLELETAVSCGDGFVDRAAGEECEPELPETFLAACEETRRREGNGACDPQTCTIINSMEQCGVCGDGFVDTELGEECEGDELNGQACPGGKGTLLCQPNCQFDQSLCESCGNGVLDEGEECEPTMIPGFGSQRPCAGGDGLAKLEPIYGGKDYASGTTSRCNEDDCTWDRSSCGFCGDGIRDISPILVPPSTMGATERCDGADKDFDRLEERFSDNFWCPADDEIPNAACVDSCDDFVLREPQCCKKRGERCADTIFDDIKCCYAYDNPEDTEPCVFAAGGFQRVCK